MVRSIIQNWCSLWNYEYDNILWRCISKQYNQEIIHSNNILIKQLTIIIRYIYDNYCLTDKQPSSRCRSISLTIRTNKMLMQIISRQQSDKRIWKNVLSLWILIKWSIRYLRGQFLLIKLPKESMLGNMRIKWIVWPHRGLKIMTLTMETWPLVSFKYRRY